MAQNSYQYLVLVEDLVLTWPSSFNGGPVISDINDIEVIGTPRTLTLPAANLVSPGQNFIINNVDGPDFDLLYNDGSTVLSTIPSGEAFQFYLTDASTANGVWRKVTPLGGFNGIVSLTAESADNSITITGSPVTPPNGILDFKLPTSLTNLNSLTNVDDTDFLIVTSINPLTFKTVELLGGENITITGGNGLGSDPVIDLNTTITSLNSLTVGDMTLSGGVITNNADNGNIQLSTNGTGSVQINGVSFSSTGAISGLTNFLGIAAFSFFTDTLVGISNQIVNVNEVNVPSITGSGGTYKLNFNTPMPNLNYGVLITLGSTGGSLPFISNSYVIVRELTSVTIIVTDASGELVLAVPHGVTVIIISA